ncbi:MAG: hypothetical protein SHS37scaffold145_45 [Phage 71_18]|nr:MAG: hypothetical protein SHS37scaffold145_45 [Phage 71_18]
MRAAAFASRQAPPDANGCRRWLGQIDHNGYGTVTMTVDGKRQRTGAHRLAWFLAYGEWPPDQLDHTCHTADQACPGGPCAHRACTTVEHLESVTGAENTRRGRGHGSETHCPAGHAYDEANTYVYGARTMRACRTCHRDRQRQYRADKAAARQATT